MRDISDERYVNAVAAAELRLRALATAMLILRESPGDMTFRVLAQLMVNAVGWELLHDD